ncbi:hypothetical protein NDA16_002234 [Ustilago loliicola]|nr:hypothetical protein NDA16_002234 [Ustilago loliicola]
MASTKAVDRVWALHDFEAENPDEVSFKAGECILVVEKDDEFGDGWWQGTNQSGHTGLFPFTYTTLDRSLALSAKSGNATPDALGTPQGVGSSARPGVMHSTMADIDNALTELQSDRKPPSVNGSSSAAAAAAAGVGAVGSNPAADASRASFTSERTDADDQSDNFGESDNFASRAIAARAALAANAQKNLANDAEREKQEEQRMRAEAQRQFEEEEARQCQLLLEVEKERQAKLAAGQLDPSEEKTKAAPIAGVDMSDESDSEGSVGLLDDFQDKTHSPLFGNLASTPTEGVAAREIKPPTSNLQGIVEDDAAAKSPAQQQASLAKQETPAATSAPASAPLTSTDLASSVQPDADTAATTAAVVPASESTSKSVPALAAGAGAIAVGGAAAAAAAVANHEQSTNASATESAAVPSAADDSARSVAGDSTRTGTETGPGTGVATGTATAATSIAAGTNDDAPRSSTPAMSTPAPAPAAAAPAGAKSPAPVSANIAGDPTEWGVDQVVEWARSRGWDEASVVSKFREHEISGDVLLEMDINILKEIDIVAFGKRFQVANGIKELRSQVPGAVTTPGLSQPAQNEGLGSPALIAPGGPGSASNTPSYSPYNAGSHNGSNADGRSLSARMAETSLDQSFAPTSSRPGSFGGDRDSFGGPAQGGFGGQGFGGPAGVAAWQAQQAGQQGHGSRVPSEGLMRGSGDVPLSPTSTTQFGAMPSPRYAPTSAAGGPYDDKLGALPTSPRKRESTGSAGASEKNNRSSFFGLGQRNRKPPPAQAGRADSVVGGPASSVGDDDGRSGKGTLSRLGFARSSRNISSQSSQSNFKDQISLPTSSPHFDSNGDTARRQRQSTGAMAPNTPGTPGQAAMGAGMPANARPTSIGSAGPDAPPTSSASATAAGAAADGPVMSRIQPVDLEGWIKKKGERYNSWKPRYLALKGPDLVILRDPRAEKIKGYVNMKGYKVIADENTNPGKYGFKILHETEKPHYFSSEDPILFEGGAEDESSS